MSTFYPGIEITCPQSSTCSMQIESYLSQCDIYNLSPFQKKKKWPHDVNFRNIRFSRMNEPTNTEFV